MIKQIKLHNIPPYCGSIQSIEPDKINFIFGMNGSGKTTISRFLKDNDKVKYKDCRLTWKEDPLSCYVYNHDFVLDNFRESSIKGIFTLGKENIEIQQRIEVLNNEIKQLEKREKSLDDEVKIFENKLNSHELTYNDLFWKIKKELEENKSPFLLAMNINKGSKKKFTESLLSQYKNNRAELQFKDELKTISRDELETLCSQLFTEGAEKVEFIPSVSFDKLLELESTDILQKIIVGKEDIDIAVLIKKLGNENWFRKGVTYVNESEGKCPFCQQELEHDFLKKIEEYFDLKYLEDIQAVETLQNDYDKECTNVISNVTEILNKDTKILDKEELKSAFEQLIMIIKRNCEQIKSKKESPNTVVYLDTVSELTSKIKDIIDNTNKNIYTHNIRIDDIGNEQKKLTNKVWRYIINYNLPNIEMYLKKKKELNQKIRMGNKDIKDIQKIFKEKKDEYRQCEEQLTSVVPMATKINDLLKNYGFTSFFLEVDDTNCNYKLIRENGEPAFESLSDGERNFVTFLYFMHVLKGNMDQSVRKYNKVVVIDDPVSSLDSDILFLVSSLIRDLFGDLMEGKGEIKQIFVLSHNIYFFKEVSYDKGIKNFKRGSRYWIIRKVNNISEVKVYTKNPIKSTYEMLWEEIRTVSASPKDYNVAVLANTMRRILEYYFKILGGKNLHDLSNEFSDGERQVFKSLISWTNSGSHSSFDDFSATPYLFDVEKYLIVFKKLFVKTKQIEHYNMMIETRENEETNG